MSDRAEGSDELVQVRNELRQLTAAVAELRQLIQGAGTTPASASLAARSGPEAAAAADCTRIIQDGARAYLSGLTTSPYRETSQEERWWRLGWQLSKDAVTSARGAWT